MPSPVAAQPRVLFASLATMGWATCAASLKKHAARDARFTADHVAVGITRPMRLYLRGAAAARHLLGGWHERDLAFAIRGQLQRALAAHRYDAVLASPGSVALDLARWKGRDDHHRYRLAIWLDATIRSFNASAPELTPARASADAERFILEQSDVIFAMSRWAADAVIADYAIPASRIVILPPSPETSPVNEAAITARLQHPRPRILFVGHQFDRKGGPQVVAWHQAHWADLADLHVVSREAVPLPGAKNITWHGHVLHDRLMAELFPSMDLFLFPTRRELFGIVLAEAAHAALPIVTSRTSATPEIVLHGETGYLCDRDDAPAFIDAVTRLLRDAELRQRMSFNAALHARSAFDAATTYTRMFDDLLYVDRFSVV